MGQQWSTSKRPAVASAISAVSSVPEVAAHSPPARRWSSPSLSLDQLPQDLAAKIIIHIAHDQPTALARLALTSRLWSGTIALTLCTSNGMTALVQGLQDDYDFTGLELLSAIAATTSGPASTAAIVQEMYACAQHAGDGPFFWWQLLGMEAPQTDGQDGHPTGGLFYELAVALSSTPRAEQWTPSLMAEIFLAVQPPVPVVDFGSTDTTVELQQLLHGFTLSSRSSAPDRGFAVGYLDVVHQVLQRLPKEVRASFLIDSVCVNSVLDRDYHIVIVTSDDVSIAASSIGNLVAGYELDFVLDVMTTLLKLDDIWPVATIQMMGTWAQGVAFPLAFPPAQIQQVVATLASSPAPRHKAFLCLVADWMKPLMDAEEYERAHMILRAMYT